MRHTYEKIPSIRKLITGCVVFNLKFFPMPGFESLRRIRVLSFLAVDRQVFVQFDLTLTLLTSAPIVGFFGWRYKYVKADTGTVAA